jgi:hypothetical protein
VFPTNDDPADPQRPFLPADLFDPKGPWVALGNSKEDPLLPTISNFSMEDQFF